MKIKGVLYKHLYLIFALTLTLLSFIFIIFIKSKLLNMELNPSAATQNSTEIMIAFIIFIVLILALVLCFVLLIKREISSFSNKMVELIDHIISKDEEIEFNITDETLLSKLENKLKQLVQIRNNEKAQYLEEKDCIKALIADISHQIKTPIANLAMYNDTLLERDLDKSTEKQFLNTMKIQISKLQWLVESLVKMSRLESNIISLNMANSNIKDTLASAISGIYLKAEEKDIALSVNCEEDIVLYHDKKWTSEALFNILHNAVKYTNSGGSIEVSIEKWELFTKIDIKDTGMGIADKDINNIFKRFYRCSEVSEMEGVGIGLYLSREIISKQGGYIKVKSKKGVGTTFSVFMRN